MKKYDNKRLKFSVIDLIFVVLFFILSLASTYFSSQYFSTKGLFNIEKSSVDYIIPAPSKEQVDELKSICHVDSITPYVYRATTSQCAGKNYKTNLFIIEKLEDIKSTVFSDELLIKKNLSITGNQLFVSNDFAKATNSKIGDTINVVINKSEIEFIIAAIYKSDYRNVGGTVMAVMNSQIADCFENPSQYSGAYIECNNISGMSEYLKTYVPFGDLRSREDFNDDESYSIYLNERNNTDYTKTIFSSSQYLYDLHTRNNPKLYRNMISAIIFFIVSLIFSFTVPFLKTSKYTKKEVKKDVRNNFTIKKETKMYSKYYCINALFYVLSSVISIFVGYELFSKEFSIMIFVIELLLIFFSSVISCVISLNKLKLEFNNRVEELKKVRNTEGSESCETANI